MRKQNVQLINSHVSSIYEKSWCYIEINLSELPPCLTRYPQWLPHLRNCFSFLLDSLLTLYEIIETEIGRDSLVAQRLKHLPGMLETMGWGDPLEKEMATHSSTLAWRIPWREEPGRLQSMGSQRVGHNWVTSLHFKGHLVSYLFQECTQLKHTAEADSTYAKALPDRKFIASYSSTFYC